MSYKKMVLVAVVLILALFSIGLIAPQQSRAASGSLGPAIFLTPHQDDEILTMGAAVREHVLAGRRTIVVLLTDGGESGVCPVMYGPTDEGRAQCVAERDREFIASTTKMGAEPVIAEGRMTDGSLTADYVEGVVKSLAEQYPNASFKTMSEYDSIHPDHRAAGVGLSQAYIDGYTSDARWYLRYDDQPTYAGTCTGRHNLNTALDLYRPIGWKSVPIEFHRVWHSTGHRAAYSKAYAPSQRGKPGSGHNCYPDDQG